MSKTPKTLTTSKCAFCGRKTDRTFCSQTCLNAEHKRNSAEFRELRNREIVAEKKRQVFLAELKAEGFVDGFYRLQKKREKEHEDFMYGNGII